MKLQLNSQVAPDLTGSAPTRPDPAAQAVPGTPPGQSAERIAGTADGVGISAVLSMLGQLQADRGAKIDRLTVSLQGDSYRISSTEISHALVAGALS
jgi:hypothetical protein